MQITNRTRRAVAAAAIFAITVALATSATALVRDHEKGAPGAKIAPEFSNVENPGGLIYDVTERIHFLRNEDGYGQHRVDVDNKKIVIYWKEDIPRELLTKVQDIAEPRGAAVEVLISSHTSKEIEELAENVELQAKKESLPVYRVYPGNDASSLAAMVLLNTDVDRAEHSRAVERLEEISGVRVDATAVPGESKHVARKNMASPFKGGGLLRFPAGGGCTAGFSVLRNGSGRLLSAGHCYPSADPPWIKNAVQTVTVVADPTKVAVRPNIDSMLINPAPSPATLGRVYHGGYNTSNLIGVGGKADPCHWRGSMSVWGQ